MSPKKAPRKPTRKSELDRARISVFLDRETHAEARRAAAIAKLPLSDLVAGLVSKELQRLAAKEDRKRGLAKGETL